MNGPVGTPNRRGNAWIVVALAVLGLLAVAALGGGLYLADRGGGAPAQRIEESGP